MNNNIIFFPSKERPMNEDQLKALLNKRTANDELFKFFEEKGRGEKLSLADTRIIAENMYNLMENLDKTTKLKLCENALNGTKEESTKRFHKVTLPHDASDSRIRSLVKNSAQYVKIAKELAKLKNKNPSHYYSDIFQGATFSPGGIDPLFYHIYRYLRKMSHSIIKDEGLEEYYRILSKGDYNYHNIFPQHKLDDSTVITLEGSFDPNGKPIYPVSDAWHYSQLVPTVNIKRELAIDCVGLVSAPLMTLLGEEKCLRLELIPEQSNDAKVIIDNCIVQEKLELWLVVQCAAILEEMEEYEEFNTVIQQRPGVHFNHPHIRDLFSHHDEYALVAYKGGIYRIYWSGDMLKGRQDFIPESISPHTHTDDSTENLLVEFFDMRESFLQNNPHPYYKLNSIPLKSSKAATGLLQQPSHDNLREGSFERTFAEKLYDNLLKDPSEAGSIEGYLRQDAQRKKALLMRGHHAHQEQEEEKRKKANARWAKSMK